MNKHIRQDMPRMIFMNLCALLSGMFAPAVWTSPFACALSAAAGAKGFGVRHLGIGLFFGALFGRGGAGVLFGGLLSHCVIRLLLRFRSEREEALSALSAMLGCLLPALVSLPRMHASSVPAALLSSLMAMAAAPVWISAFLRPVNFYEMNTREERIAHGLLAAVLLSGLCLLFKPAGLLFTGLFVLALSSGGAPGAALGAMIASFALLLGGFGARQIALSVLCAGASGCVYQYGGWAQGLMFLVGLPLSLYLSWDSSDAFFLGAACIFPLIPAWALQRIRVLFLLRSAQSPPPLTVSAFRQHVSPSGSRICGDCGAIEHLPGGRMLFLLADGMGMGLPAREMSLRAVQAAKTFLSANLEEKSAMGAVNRMTMGEGEGYSTLDACVIDLYSGYAEFYKCGGEPAWVISKGVVTRIESESLPLGIMPDAPPMKRRIRLQPGDCVFLATDGLLNALGGADSAECALIRMTSAAPTHICRTMLRQAKKNAGRARPDDMSALCVRIERRGRAKKDSDQSDVVPLPALNGESSRVS